MAHSIQRRTKGWAAEESDFDFRRRQKIFLFSTASRLDLGPTLPPIQGNRGFHPSGYRGRDVYVTTDFHHAPWPRIHGYIPLLAHTSTEFIRNEITCKSKGSIVFLLKDVGYLTTLLISRLSFHPHYGPGVDSASNSGA
jgi:hypothetical protein